MRMHLETNLLSICLVCSRFVFLFTPKMVEVKGSPCGPITPMFSCNSYLDQYHNALHTLFRGTKGLKNI